MRKPYLIDASPEPHMLDSLINTKVYWPEAFGELIDNALDQGATKIDIHISDDSVSVIDNGAGCSDLSAMIRLGYHRNTSTTKLGRYGVGLKNVAIALGERLDIESIRDDVKRCAGVHWPTIIDSGCWNSIQATEESAKGNGTRVSISQLRGFAPKGSANIPQIQFTFSPALSAGVKIAWSELGQLSKLKPWMPPKMSRVIQNSENDSSGIGFSLTAGLVDSTCDGPFILRYKHRIIGTTSEPCKRLYPSKKFLGIVDLHGKWPLLKHKDGLRDSSPEANWLYDSLYSICESLLMELHKEGDVVELNEIAAELENAFADITGKARRRKQSGESDSVSPKETPRKTRKASRVSGEGNVLEDSDRPKGKGFNIKYEALDANTVGNVTANKVSMNIVLNEKHPIVAKFRTSKDTFSLQHIAAVLLCHHQSQPSNADQMLLQFEVEKSSDLFASLYSQIMEKIVESESLKSAAR